MSSDLYAIRLLWNGYAGLAKCDGVEVKLYAWPASAIPGVAVAELHYTPEVRDTELREMSGLWRPMTREEMKAAKTWLESVADAARKAINQ